MQRERQLLAGAGVVLGVALAYVAGRAMQTLLAGIPPGDAATFLTAAGLVFSDDPGRQPGTVASCAACRSDHGNSGRVRTELIRHSPAAPAVDDTSQGEILFSARSFPNQ